MADEVKVYTPEVIADAPFPITGEDALVESNSSSTQSSKGVYGAKETPEKGFPLKMVAKELFSTAINTISKKILKTFEFAKSGAIQIGEYIHGLSGEIKISPDGIVAKNKDGITTFAVDGTTGDAIFSGDVRAGTFTTDYFNVDKKGNVIAQSIRISSMMSNSSGAGLNQQFNSSAETDVTNSSSSFTLERDTILLIIVNINGFVVPDGAGDYYGTGIIRLYLDGSEVSGASRAMINSARNGTDYYGNPGLVGGGIHYLVTLAAGSHTLKLTGACDELSGNSIFYLYDYRMSYITLGNA